MSQYFYQKLPGGGKHIRLVNLCPGSIPDPITATISHIHLETVIPSYEALSYTWGDPGNPIAIEILDDSQPGNSTSLKVRRNLYAALQCLRLPERPRLLWIDAICLDQNSNSEKNIEIPKMPSIYSKADRVVVWLGPGSTESDLGMETLCHLSDQVHCKPTEGESRATNHCDPACKEWYIPMFHLPYNEQVWLAISDILGSEWFKRLWIWQEISLANSKALVCCGHKSMLWTAFCNVVRCLHSKLEKGPVEPMAAKIFQQNLKYCIYLVDGYGLHNDLLQLFGHTRHSSCEIRKDRLYALMGMASNKAAFSITPDYDKDDSEVFSDFTRLLISTPVS